MISYFQLFVDVHSLRAPTLSTRRFVTVCPPVAEHLSSGACISKSWPPRRMVPPSYAPRLAAQLAKSRSLDIQVVSDLFYLASLLDQQIAKGLTSKRQGRNQPKHRLRQANTMPEHANFINNTGVAAEGSHPCTVQCIRICWPGVGLPRSMLWLVMPSTFAGQALGYFLVQQTARPG